MKIPTLVIVIVIILLLLDTVISFSNFIKIKGNATAIKENYNKIAKNTKHLFGKVKSDEKN